VGLGDVLQAEYIGGRCSSRPFDVQQIQQPRLLQMQSVQENPSISRKPVPDRPSEHPDETPADSSPLATPLSNESSRNNSLRDAFIDQDALERLLDNDRTSTMHSVASTEPDYASTVSSNHEERAPVERPRAGKLKTVGNPNLAQHVPKAAKYETVHHSIYHQSSDLPNINFGPTYAYKPTGRPGIGGETLDTGLEGRSRSRSKDRLRSSGRNTPGGLSPGENHRQSYFGGAPDGDHSRNHSRRQSVAWSPAGGSPGHQQRPSLTPEQWVQQRAAMAAQPQYAVAGPAGIAHHRTGSSGSFKALQQQRKSVTKTPPPFSRTLSGDWMQQTHDQRTPPSRPHSRSASMYLTGLAQPAPPSRPNSRSAGMYLDQQPSRPHSRSAGVYLDQQPSRPNSRSAGMYLDQQPSRPNSRSAGMFLDQQPSRPHSRSAGMYLNPPNLLMQTNQTANLSAREQMHVARATGTPLLDTSVNARKKQQIDDKASAGLVGAIGAREREKAAMKTSHRSSMVVENAIRARQDQQAEAQMQAYQQQMQQMQQQTMYYGQQQAYAAQCIPGAQYGYAAGYTTPMQAQQQQTWQQQQQQQQQGVQTLGNRQSWFAGSYFGQPPQ
jgi:CCR4-NOT transcriptional complex subunit CAF120